MSSTPNSSSWYKILVLILLWSEELATKTSVDLEDPMNSIYDTNNPFESYGSICSEVDFQILWYT